MILPRVQYASSVNETRSMVELKEETLYLQLHKLSALESEEALDQLLSALWRTRKTGLHSPTLKSHLQSLLNLSSPSQLDPVLACLRSLIRKWVHEEFTVDGLLKLFPPDLPLGLQSSLVLLLQKYQSQWKDQIATEERPLVKESFTCVGISGSLLGGFGASLPIASAADASQLTSTSSPTMGILPRLKSMTWTLENSNSGPPNRVAVINLKLQDCTKSPLNEVEVKFQLTKDTLEAMLRSLTYIKEQLSSMVGTTSGPSQKKQKQSDGLV